MKQTTLLEQILALLQTMQMDLSVLVHKELQKEPGEVVAVPVKTLKQKFDERKAWQDSIKGFLSRCSAKLGGRGESLIMKEAWSELPGSNNLKEYIATTRALWAVTARPDGPYYVIWPDEAKLIITELFSEAFIPEPSRVAQQIWDKIKRILPQPCASWYARMVWEWCVRGDHSEALLYALSGSDWDWIEEHIREEHLNAFMSAFLHDYAPDKVKKAVFGNFTWYDTDFIEALDAVTTPDNKFWQEFLHKKGLKSYKELWREINPSPYNALWDYALKVPLCEWPREAVEALNCIRPKVASRLLTPKD